MCFDKLGAKQNRGKNRGIFRVFVREDHCFAVNLDCCVFEGNSFGVPDIKPTGLQAES